MVSLFFTTLPTLCHSSYPTGITVVLKLPYLREIQETHLYMHVHHHSSTRPVESDSDTEDDVGGKHSKISSSTLDRLRITTPVS